MFYALLLLFSVGYISAWESGDLEKYGPFNMAMKTLKCNLRKDLNLDVSGIQLYFYDFENNIVESFPINEAAQGILSLKSLDKTKKIYMFVGGFKSEINDEIEETIRQAFMKLPNSYLIIPDHCAYTHAKDGQKTSYERSVTYAYYIGKQLAQMLASLNQGGIAPKNIHAIGHSLGGQILGHVGENFIKATGEKLSRITALDPAGPCFADNVAEEQVRSGVADYVEVYHCNAGGLGSSSILGDVDFFVNKGHSQPNCGTPLIPGVIRSTLAAQCSHGMCVSMWTESVANKDIYLAYKCDNYKTFKKIKNGKIVQTEKSIAGFWNPGKATGVYYFSTEN